MKFKFKFLSLVLVVVAMLAACSGNNANEDDSTATNKTEDIKELVHEYSIGNIQNQTASITSDQLIVTDNDGKKTAYELPEDEFFVSIAPYENETHP